MQHRHALRDDQWERIKDALPCKIEDPGRTCSDNRLFMVECPQKIHAVFIRNSLILA
jgi:hypothetical protein